MKDGWIRLVPVIAFAALALTAVIASAQQRGQSGYVPYCYSPDECPRTPYDGRFTFVRVYFDVQGGGGGFGRRGGGGREPVWHHDRPNAERNLSAIMREISLVRTFDGPTGGNVFALDDPEIFRYPVLWLAEPGFWVPTDEQVEKLREYLLKGGFVIFDDFEADQWINFEAQFRRALHEAQFVPLALSHPVYHAFFDMEALNLPHPSVNVTPGFYGVHEDNDPTRRLVAIVNHNSDIAEYWEYSDQGFFPIDISNEAYKLGVNYVVYALTR